MKNTFIAVISIVTMPILAFAQTGALTRIDNTNDLIDRIVSIGDVIIYILTFAGFIFIIWNIVIYFIKGDGDDRKTAGMNILYGLIGLAVILSVWGLVNILINTFTTDSNVPKERIPSANFVNPNNGRVVVPEVTSPSQFDF